MSETAIFPRCLSTEAVSCLIKSGSNGDRQNTEHKQTPQKERESGRRGEKSRGKKKARGISNKLQYVMFRLHASQFIALDKSFPVYSHSYIQSDITDLIKDKYCAVLAFSLHSLIEDAFICVLVCKGIYVCTYECV
jgi:hypothetical protein